MKWFRFYADAVDNPKVQRLPDALFKVWVNLLCIASKNNGVLPSVSDMAFTLRMTERRTTKHLAALEDAGFLDRCRDGYKPRDWAQHEPDRPPAAEWAEIRAAIFARDDYTCAYCGERGGRLECDHVTPVRLGGRHTDDNLVAACFRCNRAKAGKRLQDWQRAETAA